MDIFFLVLSSAAILTISTKVGFFIQRTYCDIRGIALAAVLATVTAFVTLGLPFVGIVIAYFMYVYLLCRIGKVNLLPDVILATIIGSGALLAVMFDQIKDINILSFL
jgi:hypothetical protein